MSNKQNLIGEFKITLHTTDCVGLFDGRVNKGEGDSETVVKGPMQVKSLGAKAAEVAQYATQGDPVANEILVVAERRFQKIRQRCAEIEVDMDERFAPFSDELVIETKSDEPEIRLLSNVNTYAMLALRTLMIMDKTIKRLLALGHFSLYNVAERGQIRWSLKTKFRSIIESFKKYRPFVTREDFDQYNKKAQEAIAIYRHIQYINQSDKRTNEEIALHYASYEESPALVYIDEHETITDEADQKPKATKKKKARKEDEGKVKATGKPKPQKKTQKA